MMSMSLGAGKVQEDIFHLQSDEGCNNDIPEGLQGLALDISSFEVAETASKSNIDYTPVRSTGGDESKSDCSVVYDDIFQPNSQLNLILEETMEVNNSSLPQELQPFDKNCIIISEKRDDNISEDGQNGEQTTDGGYPTPPEC